MPFFGVTNLQIHDDLLRLLVVLILCRLVVSRPQLRHEVERLVEIFLPQHLESDEIVVVLAFDRAAAEVSVIESLST